MSISKAVMLGCIAIFLNGCQSWQFRDVESLPPTAALPKVSQSGVVQARYWNNVYGNYLTTLKSLASFPDNPDQIIELTELRGPVNQGDSYGVLVQGFIIPPADGQYRFFVSGDDETQFWLSPSPNTDEAAIVASVPGWASAGNYTKYAEQTSQLITMNSGQRYYFEILFKEGSGADHFSVAWEGPNLSQQVIGSDYIASLGQALYTDDQATKAAYSLGYRVGYFDGSETLPFNPSYPPEDNDRDGLYDGWEVANGLDVNDPSDAVTDPDDDLLSATDEFLMGTEESNTDTDGDGIPDGAEFAYGLNPRNPDDAALDIDSDGFTNLSEYLAGTDMDDDEDTPYQEPAYISGFVGQYFEGISFDRFIKFRVDENIAFYWGESQPIPEVPADQFSVRWSGLFTAPHDSGTRQYRFSILTDDGARLYLDEKAVINQWKNQGPTSYSYTRSLGAQEPIQVSMEYYENIGGAVARLIITDLVTNDPVPQNTAIQTPDPNDNNTQDTDTDGIPDSWELRYGLDPWSNDTAEVSNSRGVTNLEAYQGGLNPWTLQPVPIPGDAPVTTEPSAGDPTPTPATGKVTLSWTAPLTRLDGSSIALSEIDYYEVLYGQTAENLNQSVRIEGSLTSVEISDLEPGTWYFAMQVVDTSGLESPLSSPIEYRIH